MSWVVQELWRELDARLSTGPAKPSYKTFAIINEVAAKVGLKYGLTIQLNFPAGKARPTALLIGRENLSLLVDIGRKKFRGVTEMDVQKQLAVLSGHVTFEPAGHGYEGYRATLDDGRVDCLPGGVHLWCEITPSVLEFLDWLFENAYNIRALG